MGHQPRVAVDQAQAGQQLEEDQQLVEVAFLLVVLDGVDLDPVRLGERALRGAHQAQLGRQLLVGRRQHVVEDLLQPHLGQLAVEQPRGVREDDRRVQVGHERVAAPPGLGPDQRQARADLLDG